MRPRLYYVILEHGQATRIVHGCDAARQISPAYRGFKTLLAAEEFYSWWNYAYFLKWEGIGAELRARINRTTGRTT